MMEGKKYKKDYSAKTAKEWFSERKWTGFLMRVPLGEAKGYLCDKANDINSIRATAAMLNSDPECERKFYVAADFDTKVVTIQASNKDGNS